MAPNKTEVTPSNAACSHVLQLLFVAIATGLWDDVDDFPHPAFLGFTAGSSWWFFYWDS